MRKIMARFVSRAVGLLRAPLAMAGAITIVMAASTMAEAETHTENIVAEQRTALSLLARRDAVQALLPGGWTPNAGPASPNLTLIFVDRKLALTPDGKPMQAAINRLLIVAVPATNAQGEARTLVVAGYSADPFGAPGAYKVFGNGEVSLTRTEHAGGHAANTVDEHWTVKGADGGALDVKLSFTRSVPTFGLFEQKVYSGADPDFYRIYRGEQAMDVLRNPAGGADHVKSVSVRATGGRLGQAIDGETQVLAVSNAPFYRRQTFLP